MKANARMHSIRYHPLNVYVWIIASSPQLVRPAVEEDTLKAAVMTPACFMGQLLYGNQYGCHAKHWCINVNAAVSMMRHSTLCRGPKSQFKIQKAEIEILCSLHLVKNDSHKLEITKCWTGDSQLCISMDA